ncbi:MAG: hypothetical protein ABL958_12680 [Bdellovibrionia bacterium]
MEKDPFDEFEFKPLNEGIGFHKKTAQFKKALDVTQSMASVSLPLNKPLSDDRPRWTDAPQGAPRSTIIPNQTRAPQHQPSPQPQGSVPSRIQPTMPSPNISSRGTMRPEIQTRVQEQARPAARSAHKYGDVNVFIPAIIFDSIVVIGLTCLFAVAVLLIVEVDLLEIIQIARTDFMTSLSLALLCLSVLELYLIIFRSFLGATLGEWAFDIQLGTAADQASAYYPLRVILRSFIVIATGFITLPILSLIVGRDLAGVLSGLSLKNGDPIG